MGKVNSNEIGHVEIERARQLILGSYEVGSELGESDAAPTLGSKLDAEGICRTDTCTRSDTHACSETRAVSESDEKVPRATQGDVCELRALVKRSQDEIDELKYINKSLISEIHSQRKIEGRKDLPLKYSPDVCDDHLPSVSELDAQTMYQRREKKLEMEFSAALTTSHQRINDLTKALSLEESNLSEMKREVVKMKSLLSITATQNSEANRTIEQLAVKLSHAKGCSRELERRLTSATQQSELLRSELHSVSKGNRHVTSLHGDRADGEASEEIERLKKEIETREKEMGEMRIELRECLKEKNEIAAREKQTVTDRDKRIEEQDVTIKIKTRMVEELNCEVSNLKVRMMEKDMEIREVVSAVKKSEREVKRARETANKAQHHLEEVTAPLKEQIRKLVHERDKLQHSVNIQNENFQLAHDEITEVKEKVDKERTSFTARIKQLDSECDAARAQAAAQREECERLRDCVNALKRTVGERDEELRVLLNEVTRVKSNTKMKMEKLSRVMKDTLS